MLARCAAEKGSVLRGRDAKSTTWRFAAPCISARSLALFEKLNPAQSSSYVSGLLIGEEIKSAKADRMANDSPLLILGNGQLTQRYSFAMEALGTTAQALADEVTWTGLWALAHHLYPHDFI